jgi:hypothetical protein
VQEEPVAEVARVDRETLAPELERVTQLGLPKLEHILRIPTDRADGNLLRAQTAAAGIAVNAQLRADETKMKQVPRSDVLKKLLARIAEERARMAEHGCESAAETAETAVTGANFRASGGVKGSKI